MTRISTKAVRKILRNTDRAQRNDGEGHVNDLVAQMVAEDRKASRRPRPPLPHGRAVRPARKD